MIMSEGYHFRVINTHTYAHTLQALLFYLILKLN